jgi:hypothetical protein
LDLQKQVAIVRSVVELDPLAEGSKDVYSIIKVLVRSKEVLTVMDNN